MFDRVHTPQSTLYDHLSLRRLESLVSVNGDVITTPSSSHSFPHSRFAMLYLAASVLEPATKAKVASPFRKKSQPVPASASPPAPSERIKIPLSVAGKSPCEKNDPRVASHVLRRVGLCVRVVQRSGPGFSESGSDKVEGLCTLPDEPPVFGWWLRGLL